MSFEAAIGERLRGLCAGRVWPDFRPPGVSQTLPFVTWQQVGGQVVSFLEGGHPGMRNARIQVNTWDASRLGANSLMRAIEVEILGTGALQATAIGALTAIYDPAVKLYGARQDFSVWLAD